MLMEMSSTLTSPGVSLLLQSIGMLLGTLLCGTVPLYLPLSKTKLRVLEVMGAGLLVGASMTVVLPEGVSALFRSEGKRSAMSTQTLISVATTGAHKDWAWSAMSRRQEDHPGDQHGASSESIMSSALLGGFLLMFLIDQIAAPGAHIHPQAQPNSSGNETIRDRRAPISYLPSHRPESLRLTRASSLNITKLKNVAGDEHANASSTVESSPEQLPIDHDNVSGLHSPLLGHMHGGRTSPKIASTNNRRAGDADEGGISDLSHRRGLRAAFASIAGLVIHAAADGIAMGASAGSGDESLKLIILFAIMIHKAPASFGLCTLLMGRRLQKGDIYKAILVFSLSTPVGALFTYTILAVFFSSSSEGAISPQHIGAALTFSAGTFIFVAMHAVQELASAEADIDNGEKDNRGASHSRHNHQASTGPRQILGRAGRVAVFLFGTVLPKSLQSLTGHGH